MPPQVVKGLVSSPGHFTNYSVLPIPFMPQMSLITSGSDGSLFCSVVFRSCVPDPCCAGALWFLRSNLSPVGQGGMGRITTAGVMTLYTVNPPGAGFNGTGTFAGMTLASDGARSGYFLRVVFVSFSCSLLCLQATSGSHRCVYVFALLR